MQTWHIHIQGQVQGVGFRPFIYRLAKKHQFNGWVNNTIDGVHIELNAANSRLERFCDHIIEKAPPLARITQLVFRETEPKFFDNFQIIHSKAEGKAQLLFSPDFALCKDCLREINDPENRRADYAFTTCINCGPRFSIIHRLPYDREHTSMDNFQMCDSCKKEYNDPLNRRYYSQTNSCKDCGITLNMSDGDGQAIKATSKQVIEKVVRAWQNGEIVAIKGIGGFLLTCDAGNEAAINRLRERKQRPHKPLAVMFPDIDRIRHFAEIRLIEIEALTSEVAPIVLLRRKKGIGGSMAFHALAPELINIGVMLPYAPLYELLLRQFNQPVVATSGNISRSPIIFRDDRVHLELGTIADYIVIHNRPIVIPQDDSLIRHSEWYSQKIILRRSRGMAPTYINPSLKWKEESVLAAGAMLKSTFSLLHQSQIYVSPYLGDLTSYDTQENYRHIKQHFIDLLKITPSLVLCDQHPNYPSTRIATEYATAQQVPLIKIQHHIAHFAAVLGENDLLESKQNILGVIWDGTGWGEDRQIWGGEYFVFTEGAFKRDSHLDYFPFIAGDKMPREPRISALAATYLLPESDKLLEPHFSPGEWKIYNQLLSKDTPLKTSSAGRLFDAVSALLGIRYTQSYEGQAAMEMEKLAGIHFREAGLEGAKDYLPKGKTSSLLQSIIKDIKSGMDKKQVAANFHFTLVKMIDRKANNLKINHLAFSGGVFQNSLLVDLIIHHLKGKYKLYFHRDLSPNDECISFGQLMYYKIKTDNHVFSNSRKD